MKKVILLFAALSLCVSSFSATYIIKDGKLQNGVKWASEDWCNGTSDLKPASKLTEYADKGYVEIARSDYQYVGCRLELDPSVFNLHLYGVNIVFEYELPHSAMLYSSELKGNEGLSTELRDKPLFHVVCGKEVGSEFKFTQGTSEKSHICQHRIDGKFNPNAEKEFVKYESYSFAKSDDKVNTIYIAYMRELADNSPVEPAKIKNLYFYAPESFQPFFGASFDFPDIWSEAPTVMISDTLTDDPNDMKAATAAYLTYFQDGKVLTQYNYDDTEVNSKTGKRNYLAVAQMMLYENDTANYTGSDGSGYLSPELFHGLLVGNKEFNKVPTGAYTGFENIPLPEKYEGDQLKVSCVVKAVQKYYDGLLKDNQTDLPIYYKFDNQTEETKLFGDSVLRMIYTPEVNTLTIPAGAKAISIYFKQNKFAGYLVDNLTLAVNWTTSVANVSGDSKSLSVYPNPVQNQISFSGIEDIETVDIVSLNGKVASFLVVDGMVNVSKLAAGEYVIIVNKSITGKFIKK